MDIVCRCCLASDATHDVAHNAAYHQFYQQITNVPFQDDSGKPTSLCYECLYQFRKCMQLRDKCLIADRILNELIVNGMGISRESILNINRDGHLLPAIFTHQPTSKTSTTQIEHHNNRVIKIEDDNDEVSENITDDRVAIGCDDQFMDTVKIEFEEDFVNIIDNGENAIKDTTRCMETATQVEEGSRDELLSADFRRDMEAHHKDLLGSETSVEVHRPTKIKFQQYSPDHDLDEICSDDCSTSMSFKDPLDDNTSSIIDNLEKIQEGTSEDEDSWEKSSDVIWTSSELCSNTEEFKRTQKILRSAINAMNKDSGNLYTLNVGLPDTLFITKASSLSVSKRVKPSKVSIPNVNPALLEEIQSNFTKGVFIEDVDEPGKGITVSNNTPGFSRREISDAVSQGKVTVREILEHIYRLKGRWNYIISAYELSNL